MQIFKQDNNFGVTMILPSCFFSAELKRETIREMMEEIEARLTEQGAEDDASRIDFMMDNASAVSEMVANGDVDYDEGVADIAYSAIYAFGKTIGFDKIADLRGLTGTMLRNVLSLNPCMGEAEYQEESASLQQIMEGSSAMTESIWKIQTATPPTVH